jgi:hypothetical protein
MPKLVGRIKTSTFVQQLLYARYSDEEKPRLALPQRDRLRATFAPDIALLDEILGADFSRRWGYRADAPRQATELQHAGVSLVS